MVDKYRNRELINLGKFKFYSKRFEVWSGGKMIDAGNELSLLSFETLTYKNPSQNSILVEINSSLNTNHLSKINLFDTAYTNIDRILLGTIARTSNYYNYSDYIAFVSNAPFFTRDLKIFEHNDPFACSIFKNQGIIEKITFTTTGTKSLIEFYLL